MTRAAAAAAACLLLVVAPLWLPAPTQAARALDAPSDNSTSPAPTPSPSPPATISKPTTSRPAGSAALAARVQPRTPSPPAVCITPGQLPPLLASAAGRLFRKACDLMPCMSPLSHCGYGRAPTL